MRCGRTFRLAKTHPAHARSSGRRHYRAADPWWATPSIRTDLSSRKPQGDRHDPTGMSRPQCAMNIPMEKEVWSCAKDEGRPLASRDQELDANRCKLLPLRAVVVSVAERVGPDPALVHLGETSESKPSMKGRKGIVDVETEVMWSSRDKLGRRLEARPKRHPARRRRDSETGFCTERGNLSS